MNPTLIIAAIQAAAALAKELGPLVESGVIVLHSNDEARIKQALADLQSLSDVQFEATQRKLRQPPG